MKNLEILKDYAKSGDNVWLQKKLIDLEREISLSILENTIKTIKELKEMI